MEYIVTYQFNEENDLWKTTRFTDKEKAEDYCARMLNQWNKVYFSITNDGTLIGCEKKYEITYFQGANYRYILNNLENGNSIRPTVKTVEGKLINYDSPFTGRFFIENNNGALEIIPMISVVEMREIKEL